MLAHSLTLVAPRGSYFAEQTSSTSVHLTVATDGSEPAEPKQKNAVQNYIKESTEGYGFPEAGPPAQQHPSRLVKHM